MKPLIKEPQGSFFCQKNIACTIKECYNPSSL